MSQFILTSRLLIVTLFFVLMIGCKNSSFEDVVSRCLPECDELNSPLPTQEVKAAFEATIANTQKTLAINTLTGRWIMLVADRFSVNGATEKQVNDVLFTKTLLLTDNGDSLDVTDCHTEESYALSAQKTFSIPKNSDFFNIPDYDNLTAIQVNENSDNLKLSALWKFVTPQQTAAQLQVDLYKVDNLNLADESLGKLNGNVDIFCYSYLNLFTIGEKLVVDRWFKGEAEYKEMILKLDEADALGDSSLSMSITDAANELSYQIRYNQNEIDEYTCFGTTSFSNDSDDFLSFSGNLDLLADVECLQGSLDQDFSFSGLATF